MRIKVTSDSTCDLSKELLEKYNISVIPLTVVKEGENFFDGVTITPQEIFDHVAAGGSLCTTAAISIGEYEELFAPLSKEYDAVIHVNISSEFSSCYQNATIASQNFSNVRVIDSRNLSSGHGLIVLAAAQMGQEMDDLDAICENLRELTGRVEASFVLKRLDYMAKGGRCSSATALGANLLNLRPCIEVRDGKMLVVKKYRGAYAKCLVSYIKDRLDGRDDIDRNRIFITHTTMHPEDLEAAKAGVQTYGSFNEVLETVAGCTVSCHCGPDTLGVLFVRKK